MKLRLRVGQIMREKGVSIRELAEQADISPNTAKGLYYGITTRVDFPILDRVALALGVTPLDLLEQTEEEARRARQLAAA